MTDTMKLPCFVVKFLIKRLLPLSYAEADEIIGPGIRSRKTKGHVHVPKAFLIRWFVIPKNRWFNIYLHQFIRDDEDRATHDHPWPNASVLLIGSYVEVVDDGTRTTYNEGDVKFRSASSGHRIELPKAFGNPPRKSSWSLFITGPVIREWGYHCSSGWISHEGFADRGGCGED